MAINRYTDTNQIVGQFLPKIYTNRITVEDLGVYSAERPGQTKITVDYHIKDVLDQNGLGVITQTREGEDGSDLQGKILQSLKVATVLLNNSQDATEFVRDVYKLSEGHWTEDISFALAIRFLSMGYTLNGKTNELYIQDGRPQELGFEFRNTIYETYDQNNNVINVIPYSRSYEINNEEWDNCSNLSLVCFTFFDFTELGLSIDGFSNENANKLGYMVGDLTYDSIFVGGNVVSTARIYRDTETNSPYYGPVHYHSSDNPGPNGYVGYMAGFPGKDMGPRLKAIQVPVTKVQDFRKLQRAKLVNYYPAQLEGFRSLKPELSYLEKRNKNFFHTENVIVDYDHGARNTNIEFTVDFKDIFKNNSRYYDLLHNIPIYDVLPLNYLMKIVGIRIVRRRVSNAAIGHNKFGAPKRIKFDRYNQMDHVVVSTSDARDSLEIIEKQDDFGYIKQTGRTSNMRSFFVKDYEISNYHNSNTTHQYGVEITINDTTKDFLLLFLERGRLAVNDLKRYEQKCSIPMCDTHYIKKEQDGLPIGLGADEYPEYADRIQHGNYNTRTKSFTNKFKREARQEFGANYNGFAYYVDTFLILTQFSFGKTSVSLTRSAVNSVQRDDRLQSPLSALKSLKDDGVFDLPDGQGGGTADRQSLINMIDPSNARPETISAFIRSFEDLVLEMEDYLDVDYRSTINNEGSGYTSKGDKTIKVQKWFNNTVYGVDQDNYITLRPSIFFDYGLGRSFSFLPRVIDYAALLNRVKVEIDNYNISPDAPIVLTPSSVVIGDTIVHFGGGMGGVPDATSDDSNPYGQSFEIDPEDADTQNALGIFIEELLRLQEEENFNEMLAYMSSFEQLEQGNLYSGILGLIDHMSPNTVVYGEDVSPLTAIPPEINFRINSNQCGLVDNTPVQQNRQERSIFFPELEGFAALGYSQIGVLLGSLSPSAQIANLAPQIASADFPSGGIYDTSPAVLFNGVNALTYNSLTSLTSTSRIDIGSLDVLTGGSLNEDLAATAAAIGQGSGPGRMPRRRRRQRLPSSHGFFRASSIMDGRESVASAASAISAAANTGAAQAAAAISAITGTGNTDDSDSSSSSNSSAAMAAVAAAFSGFSGGGGY
tara:strand:- start:38077 stop:41397 length:3321 start_codon:yes stop_codon:yes gene_type:complete